jgi:hypothetical protein
MYTKIPLSLLKIKKEVKISGKPVVYNIHPDRLSAYKNILFFNITTKMIKNLSFINKSADYFCCL